MLGAQVFEGALDGGAVPDVERVRLDRPAGGADRVGDGVGPPAVHVVAGHDRALPGAAVGDGLADTRRGADDCCDLPVQPERVFHHPSRVAAGPG